MGKEAFMSHLSQREGEPVNTYAWNVFVLLSPWLTGSSMSAGIV